MIENYIYGRRPVLEALRQKGQVQRVLIAKGSHEGSIRQIWSLAKDQGLYIEEVERAVLDRYEEGVHQGVIAFTEGTRLVDVETLMAKAAEKNEPLLLALLDGITDPHNFGAIIRSAEVLGVHGVVFPKRRSAPLSATVMKSAAGALSHMALSQVSNLDQTVRMLQDQGVWVAVAAAEGDVYLDAVDFNVPFAIVIGSEGEGVSELLRKRADLQVKIPMQGQISSLNASVAASLFFYEAMRQRKRGKNG